jgi:hypothetical protein
MKWLAQRVLESLSTPPGGEAARRARALLVQVARRQVERELAFFRMTGFPRQAGDLEAVLTATAEGPKTEI